MNTLKNNKPIIIGFIAVLVIGLTIGLILVLGGNNADEDNNVDPDNTSETTLTTPSTDNEDTRPTPSTSTQQEDPQPSDDDHTVEEVKDVVETTSIAAEAYKSSIEDLCMSDNIASYCRHDANDNIIELSHADGTLHEFEYDSNGDIIKHHQFVQECDEVTQECSRKTLKILNWSIELKYDGNIATAKLSGDYATSTYTLEYDEARNLIKQTDFDEDGNPIKIDYFDEDGNIYKIRLLDTDGNVIDTIEYKENNPFN